ncbi:hypothetical protein HG531_006656 [Fusarium graminearum]|nr:hypothetical protein HG531_006656 [Fusarium graminearum]
MELIQEQIRFESRTSSESLSSFTQNSESKTNSGFVFTLGTHQLIKNDACMMLLKKVRERNDHLVSDNEFWVFRHQLGEDNQCWSK